jgi:ribose/xylose/arabinose/galactoside ABC-type transport system permease subunit
MAGGIGNVLQSIIGVLIIGMIRNGINLSELNIFWNDFVTGGVIIIAVLLDTFRQYASSKIEEKSYLKKANNNGENNE